MKTNPGLSFVVDNKIPFLKGVLEPFGKVSYLKGQDISSKDLKYADGLLIRTRTKINSSLLKNTRLKFIATATIGFDHIDTNACKQHQIVWCNAPGCNSGSVYQYLASALVFLADKYRLHFKDLTLGIIGVGQVGSKIERLGNTLGFKVLINDPPRARQEGPAKFKELEYLIKHSDIISFHVPLNKEGPDKTLNMVDKDLLMKFKKNAFLINTSRGDIIVEEDLKKSLKSGHISGAVLDVWRNEPDIDIDLLKVVDIGTSHIAGYSIDGKANGTSQSIQNLSRYFSLGLDNWHPPGLPQPKERFIIMSGTGKSDQQIFSEAIQRTYQIESDFSALLKDPSAFEQLRGAYPPRREFHAYSLSIDDTKASIKDKCNFLGFNIK